MTIQARIFRLTADHADGKYEFIPFPIRVIREIRGWTPFSSRRSPRTQAKRAVNPRFSAIHPNRGRFPFSVAMPRCQLAAPPEISLGTVGDSDTVALFAIENRHCVTAPTKCFVDL
jgi:hypothetical protein